MTAISLLTPDDRAEAFAIERRSHAFPWSEQTFASNQGERFLNLRLDAEGKMAAFAITQVVLDEASLFNIAVDPAWQRRGFGRQLLQHLIDELIKRDVLTLWLEVRASNLPAIALYEQMGFNQVSRRSNYYPTASGREDALMMALTL
ncbi:MULTISPECIES: ribosomal protein S18-alanine N-acetyltransferase [Pantoea]|jgi:ribosomal-protein-alanine N-acetyltransferase|uniref:[Ribosomal protein bS18]-alanine N-acetyltransferase n=1 Tax=Pantoea anthophila TaxID=470931 RepID=A0ABY2Z6J4_9GAMM|nr:MULTISPECIES: ribosomal protein S18-alanine N-acetyltransferase [Pantoea]KAF6657541.1 ribosomal protein S18-alanine N-acetyltransferase [Enterobacteriaceae bacterium EKM102V]TPE16846.1 ribosomal-protein-alanine N-acetyltransferase [Pantoea vagans]EIC00032.1 ribosomal-protein-alanine N-acetyltransferase [Pantoea sp. Sc1]KAA5974609.1 ribosomal-protein-alanine N-acetyltransferase [Pantoea sp. M_8]KAA5976018.1 ribosomal-protein-alanine N-acetyltransferase [Pantoea sp. M_6]